VKIKNSKPKGTSLPQNTCNKRRTVTIHPPALSYYFGQWLIQQLVLPYKAWKSRSC